MASSSGEKGNEARTLLISLRCCLQHIHCKIIFLILVNYHNILQNKYNYKTYHKDISFLSGRTKAIITKYGIARTDFKRLMIYHQIPNLKKSSW